LLCVCTWVLMSWSISNLKAMVQTVVKHTHTHTPTYTITHVQSARFEVPALELPSVRSLAEPHLLLHNQEGQSHMSSLDMDHLKVGGCVRTLVCICVRACDFAGLSVSHHNTPVWPISDVHAFLTVCL
jgi:hypothetical protein